MFPKGKPAVITRTVKRKAEKKAWRKTAKAVDTRDAVDESPVCFVTGKRLQVRNGLDEWTFRDRAHLEARSQSKARKHEVENVLSVSRAVHKLIDSSSLLLFTKRGKPALTRRSIDHVAWNRRMVARGSEPCRVRKGLPVVEIDWVRD